MKHNIFFHYQMVILIFVLLIKKKNIILGLPTVLAVIRSPFYNVHSFYFKLNSKAVLNQKSTTNSVESNNCIVFFNLVLHYFFS